MQDFWWQIGVMKLPRAPTDNSEQLQTKQMVINDWRKVEGGYNKLY